MASLDSSTIDKPIESIHPDNLPTAEHHHITKALSILVERSDIHPDVKDHVIAPMHTVKDLLWLHPLIPGIEHLAARYHVGNYVAVRGSDGKFFESMPIYAR